MDTQLTAHLIHFSDEAANRPAAHNLREQLLHITEEVADIRLVITSLGEYSNQEDMRRYAEGFEGIEEDFVELFVEPVATSSVELHCLLRSYETARWFIHLRLLEDDLRKARNRMLDDAQQAATILPGLLAQARESGLQLDLPKIKIQQEDIQMLLRQRQRPLSANHWLEELKILVHTQRAFLDEVDLLKHDLQRRQH